MTSAGIGLAFNLILASPASAARLEFKYDPLGQLASAQDSDGDTLSYAYDEVGNMVGLTPNKLAPGQSAIQWASIGSPSGIAISLSWATAGSLQLQISDSPDFRNAPLQSYRGQALPIPFNLKLGATPIYVQFVAGGESYVLETAVIRSPGAVSVKYLGFQSDRAVRIDWTAASDGLTGFVVERRSNGSSAWSTLSLASIGARTFVDASPRTEESYEYRVVPMFTNVIGGAALAETAAFLAPPLYFSAPDGDPDQDGLNTLMERLLGTDPSTPNDVSSTLRIVNFPTGRGLVYPLATIPSDVTGRVEWSTNLRNWTSDQSSISEDPGDATHRFVTVIPQVDPTSNLFFRIIADSAAGQP